MTSPLRVLVTGAAGQIGYSILQPLACGRAFGENTPIHIVMFDLERCEDVMKGVAIELEDLASTCLHGITIATKEEEAFKDIDVMIGLAGALALSEGMTRSMLCQTNKPIYARHGQLLEMYAKKTVKVLVVANPCNTLCLVLSKNAPSIPKKNFSCLTRLDHNRSISQIASTLEVPCNAVKKMIVWGNHSSTMVPDPSMATVLKKGKVSLVTELINDEKYWSKFFPTIQERAMAVVHYRKRTSALSSAMAAIDHLNSWFLGSPEDDFVSMGVYSDGTLYGAPNDVFFGFPCKCTNGEYEIIKGIKISEELAVKLKQTGDDLLDEKKAVE